MNPNIHLLVPVGLLWSNWTKVKSVDPHVWTSVTLNSGEVNAAALNTTEHTHYSQIHLLMKWNILFQLLIRDNIKQTRGYYVLNYLNWYKCKLSLSFIRQNVNPVSIKRWTVKCILYKIKEMLFNIITVSEEPTYEATLSKSHSAYCKRKTILNHPSCGVKLFLMPQCWQWDLFISERYSKCKLLFAC